MISGDFERHLSAERSCRHSCCVRSQSEDLELAQGAAGNRRKSGIAGRAHGCFRGWTPVSRDRSIRELLITAPVPLSCPHLVRVGQQRVNGLSLVFVQTILSLS